MSQEEYVLSPAFYLEATDGFKVFSQSPFAERASQKGYHIKIDWECAYTRNVIYETVNRRPWCKTVAELPAADGNRSIQIADFENIVWDDVLAGKYAASSYLVRKGLSRKAQLSLQTRRYISKHPSCILKRAMPKTIIIETWNAFEDDMKIDIGGGLTAGFDIPGMKRVPLRQRLDWILNDAKQQMEDYDNSESRCNGEKMWIMKPSVANKGADISIIRNWDDVLDGLEATEDMREWVLQEYIANPLLINRGYKFHFRVYVLCIGAIKVFVFDQILMLLAAHTYCAEDTFDILCHLTNTARAAEDIEFKEEKFVKLMEDLPSILFREYRRKFTTIQSAELAVQELRDQIHKITGELFAAFENEYSIFCPMPQCYELFGLDFLVDENMSVHLLEVNPGPDFKQTGGRLRKVIVQLWEQVFRLSVDMDLLFDDAEDDLPLETTAKRTLTRAEWMNRMAPDFSLVYDKEWSVAHLKSNISLT